MRRDLRLHDNAGLFHALKSSLPVKVIFIFDVNILNKLKDNSDPRVTYIYKTLSSLDDTLKSMGSSLQIYHNCPIKVWEGLCQDEFLRNVFVNRDYEQYSIERDSKIEKLLKRNQINFHTFKDHVVFENIEVAKNDMTPYTVYSPYKKKWLKKLGLGVKPSSGDFCYLESYPCDKYYNNFLKVDMPFELKLEDMGFVESKVKFPSNVILEQTLIDYEYKRDFPNIEGTSKLGIHLRFGVVSIRELVNVALRTSQAYLNELIWRDFYSMILQSFPHVEKNCFKLKYNNIEWRADKSDFESWSKGFTGYPLVDAGMRELNSTGFMNNRVRMVTASFLTKHLLIDWRKGEQYFSEKLLDFDLASNNGGWQWAAGCGTDAAPYFRIFNPYAQAEKFDKQNGYIKKWVPEFGTNEYIQPIVEHKFARKRCLEVYRSGLRTAEKE